MSIRKRGNSYTIYNDGTESSFDALYTLTYEGDAMTVYRGAGNFFSDIILRIEDGMVTLGRYDPQADALFYEEDHWFSPMTERRWDSPRWGRRPGLRYLLPFDRVH